MDSTSVDRDVLEKKLHDPTASPIPLPFEFLKDITCNFSNEQELGKGGYGVVYKGVLKSGKIIAVKKLFDHLVDDDQFHKEVSNLIEIRHQNIVQLVGYCAESRSEAIKLPSGTHVMAQIPRSLLCFEYLGKKSLDMHVSDESSGLDWDKRYEIKGICSGLHFLHGECHIVHLDLKPENILMDDAMIPKIADFGLSRLLGAQKSRTIISGILAGSLGYMAPEYLMQGVISHKADIFSFGVIIIQIITGGKEYPMSTIPYFQELNENGSHQSAEISFKRYIENVLGKWRDVFEKEPKYLTPEIYTEQVEQCMNIAIACVDFDPTRRPEACDISQMLTGEICSCQRGTLISAQPFELRFRALHGMTFSSLHLTNNTDHVVAFRIVTNNWEDYFARPVHGSVPARSTYTLRIAMHRPPKNDNRFTVILESTILGKNSKLPDVDAFESVNKYNDFFTEAKAQGLEVQKVKLLFVITHESEIVILRGHPASSQYNFFAHPTKTWIISLGYWGKGVHIWDYQTEETVHSSEFSALDSFGNAIFVPRKQWFVAASLDSGYIKVYSYEMTQQVKTFTAHGGLINSLDVHPVEPFVLSSSCIDKMVKLWNWEKGWECVRIFYTEAFQVKFNPKDADYFACATQNGVEIYNISSPRNGNRTFFIESYGVWTLDYSTCGDQVYLITGHHCGLVKIWDWHSRICLKTFERHTGLTVCVHPDRQLLMTGSHDGTVCLWNSFTFELEGILNCGLGFVQAIACLKGSNRIAIGHERGLAITEV